MTGRSVNVYHHMDQQLICKPLRWKILTYFYAKKKTSPNGKQHLD